MSNKPIVYVTRDIERALGKEPSASFIIVSNNSPYSQIIKSKYPDYVHLIESKFGPMGTIQLLQHPTTQQLIKDMGADLVVFKNSKQIEATAAANNWRLLNPSAELAEKIENKISQIEWLGDLNIYLPEHNIQATKDIVFKKETLIVQWAHSHSGDGTMLVRSQQELDEIQKKFPDRPARVATYVSGPSFTVNIVVAKDTIFMGNISYQITGILPFTENQFTTVGNDWSLTHSLLNEDEIQQIELMAKEVGEKMREDGWRGLFGIDVMRDDERNKIYLIEINSRQPASTTYESNLQEENRKQGLAGYTTFEIHLMALNDAEINDTVIPINDGAQIIQRITKDTKEVKPETIESLQNAGYKVLSYSNTEINTDLIRIQSAMGIVETHNKLNKRGKEIRDIIHPVLETIA